MVHGVSLGWFCVTIGRLKWGCEAWSDLILHVAMLFNDLTARTHRNKKWSNTIDSGPNSTSFEQPIQLWISRQSCDD